MPHSLPGFKSDSGLQVVVEESTWHSVQASLLFWVRLWFGCAEKQALAEFGQNHALHCRVYNTAFSAFMLYLSGSQKSKKLNSSLCQTACVIEGMGVAGVTRGPEHIFKSMGFWDLDLGFRVSIGLSKGATLNFKTPHFLE